MKKFKIYRYFELLVKCNTLENENEVMKKQIEEDTNDKAILTHQIRELKRQLRDMRKKNLNSKKKVKKNGRTK